jgi:MIP family channel proteins
MAQQAGKTFLAEVIGTFGVTLFAAGAILHDASDQAIGMTGIAMAYGLAVLLAVYAFGPVSGGHLNPAVSFAMALTKRLSWAAMLRYWIAQLLGAALAGWALAAFYRGGPLDVHLGTPAVDPTITASMAAVIEGILTFFLVVVVFATAVDPRAPKGFAGLAIGMAITAGVLMGGTLTGGAVNPARAFGPAFASGYWQDHWVYWAGPLIGGAVAAFLYDRFFLERG